MKILCVIDNLSTGGAQRQMVNLAVGLNRRGHKISLFCYSPGALLARPLEEEGIPVRLQVKESRYSLSVIRGLRRLIDEDGCQVVVSFLNTPNFYSILSSRLSKSRPAVVVSERFCDIPGNPNATELAVRQLYRLSDKVIVNSHHQRLNFLRRYSWMKGRVLTIYNGYDLREFVPLEIEPEDKSLLRILVVAGVSRYKNGLCLVRALDILQKEHGLRPVLSWAGKRGTAGDSGTYLSEMEDEIRQFGISERWQWLDQRTDIAGLLSRHDVLVHPSYGEGLPNAVCEALACGRPVIVSDALDHPHLVREGVNGFLFDYRDPADLARKILKFYELSEDERRLMGRRGREYAEMNLSLERYVDDYERIFAEAVK